MSFDVRSALEFREVLLADLVNAGRDGVRITPENVVAAAYLIAHDLAEAYLNGFEYLCLRSAKRSPPVKQEQSEPHGVAFRQEGPQMPMLLILPAMMFVATMTAMGQVAMQTFPVPAPADPATARRRAFKVIKGGQQVVLDGAEGAHYRHRQEP